MSWPGYGLDVCSFRVSDTRWRPDGMVEEVVVWNPQALFVAISNADGLQVLMLSLMGDRR
jgi:hypothetical protein